MSTHHLFRHAAFETSIAKPGGLPPALADTPEIAFVGRSNAGKSSALNTLAGHTRLAFVSKTPGRTQLINFFRLPNGARLVDLPGYGYAAVPEAIRRSWANLLEHYLKQRENLIGLVMIMDARRPLTELDLQMIDWFLPTANPIHILLSKADKLSRQEASKTLRAVRQAVEIYGDQITVQLFSSLKKTGIAEAETVIGQWLANWERLTLTNEPATEQKAEQSASDDEQDRQPDYVIGPCRLKIYPD
ncbi:MAG: ribosome biogenesis GTP-binding protein YihA/YsxC [Sterolibacterium sp.]|nr:ribosome biogenesis GTP-binding protein YihA/YsxC [Sterolibacterium sp.]